MALQILQPTFMLLPNFTTPPDKTIVLGTLLGRGKGLKTRPDASRPLTRHPNPNSNAGPDPTTITTSTITNFHFTSTHTRGSKADIFADIPVISAIGGSLGFNHEATHKLVLDCEEVEVRTFDPSAEDLLRLLSSGGKVVDDYLSSSWRPSVFLVTGLMIASAKGAKVQIVQSAEIGGKASVSSDLTALGAPVKVGLGGGGHGGSSATRRMHVQGPFVMAYRLLRVRASRKGGVRASEGFNTFALFDDEGDALGSAGEKLEERWEVEAVTEEGLVNAGEEDSEDDD